MTDQITTEQRARILDIVAAQPGIGIAHALRDAGIPGSKGQLKQLVADDPDLADEIHEARGRRLRQELMSRAIDGYTEPIISVKGDIVGERQVKSDRLLEFACRMYLPEARVLQAHRQHVEVTGQGGGPVQVQQGVSLADVAAVLQQARAIAARPDTVGAGTDRPALPAAGEVLAEPLDV